MKKDCCICGITFEAHNRTQKACSGPCKKAWACCRSRSINEKKKNVTSARCIRCGKTFTPTYGDKRKRFCSTKCGRQHNRPPGCRRGWSELKRRNRTRWGSGAERFDPAEIFERDRWECRLCGCDTPRSLRGTKDWHAPELDHIAPLSLGGKHTRENTQCLCRACNQEKGATIPNKTRTLIYTIC
jgi:hypothetical protein